MNKKTLIMIGIGTTIIAGIVAYFVIKSKKGSTAIDGEKESVNEGAEDKITNTAHDAPTELITKEDVQVKTEQNKSQTSGLDVETGMKLTPETMLTPDISMSTSPASPTPPLLNESQALAKVSDIRKKYRDAKSALKKKNNEAANSIRKLLKGNDQRDAIKRLLETEKKDLKVLKENKDKQLTQIRTSKLTPEALKAISDAKKED
jgi:hypothetical protein